MILILVWWKIGPGKTTTGGWLNIGSKLQFIFPEKQKSIKYLEVDEIEMAGLEIDLGGGATLNGE